jgi:hypothetical protein
LHSGHFITLLLVILSNSKLSCFVIFSLVLSKAFSSDGQNYAGNPFEGGHLKGQEGEEVSNSWLGMEYSTLVGKVWVKKSVTVYLNA